MKEEEKEQEGQRGSTICASIDNLSEGRDRGAISGSAVPIGVSVARCNARWWQRQPAKIAEASSLRLAHSQQAILGHTRAHDYL